MCIIVNNHSAMISKLATDSMAGNTVINTITL